MHFLILKKENARRGIDSMRVLAVHGVLPLLAVLPGAIATPAVVRSTPLILRRAGSPLLLQRQEEVTGGLLRRPASFADGKTGVVVPTSSDSSYAQWAKDNPLANNLGIATVKTASADLLAQLVIAQTPVAELDYSRLLLFASFGLVYLGGFQYLYQVRKQTRYFRGASKTLPSRLRDTSETLLRRFHRHFRDASEIRDAPEAPCRLRPTGAGLQAPL